MPSPPPAIPLTELQLSKFNDYSQTDSVTVFCWSRTEPGTPLWKEAEELGRRIATAGLTVVSGGYCGSMEAVSKGAREVIDALPAEPAEDIAVDTTAAAAAGVKKKPEVVGVLVPGQFPDRALVGNKFLTRSIDAENFPRRVEILTGCSRYYVILPGTLGTLQEFTTVWILSLLHPSCLPRPRIFAYRNPWEALVTSISAILNLPENNTVLIEFVDNAEEVVERIIDDIAQIRGSATVQR